MIQHGTAPAASIHHLASIPSVAGGIRPCALADSSHCGRISRQSLQDSWCRVLFGGEPGCLCHHLSIEACKSAFDVAPPTRQGQQFFSRFDLVKVCPHSCPVPSLPPGCRKGGVLARRRDGHGPDARCQLGRACRLDSIGRIGHERRGCWRAPAIRRNSSISSAYCAPTRSLAICSLPSVSRTKARRASETGPDFPASFS